LNAATEKAERDPCAQKPRWGVERNATRSRAARRTT